MRTLIQDDMVFHPYMMGYVQDGWQCKIPTDEGIISIRFGGRGLFVSEGKPYEVWYPNQDCPTPDQTADDIYEYIKNPVPKKGYTFPMKGIPNFEEDEAN